LQKLQRGGKKINALGAGFTQGGQKKTFWNRERGNAFFVLEKGGTKTAKYSPGGSEWKHKKWKRFGLPKREGGWEKGSWKEERPWPLVGGSFGGGELREGKLTSSYL